MGSVLVVHPPVTVARDWIDYPYFADLGAVQLTAELEREHTVRLVDAYALPGSTLYWRRDGCGHLGASVDEVHARTSIDPWFLRELEGAAHDPEEPFAGERSYKSVDTCAAEFAAETPY